MGEDLNGRIFATVDDNNIWYTTYNSGYGFNTNNYAIVSENEELKKEIKKLKRQIANLTTLICTHIGQEQMKEFYEKNNRECEIAKC